MKTYLRMCVNNIVLYPWSVWTEHISFETSGPGCHVFPPGCPRQSLTHRACRDSGPWPARCGPSPPSPARSRVWNITTIQTVYNFWFGSICRWLLARDTVLPRFPYFEYRVKLDIRTYKRLFTSGYLGSLDIKAVQILSVRISNHASISGLFTSGYLGSLDIEAVQILSVRISNHASISGLFTTGYLGSLNIKLSSYQYMPCKHAQ